MALATHAGARMVRSVANGEPRGSSVVAGARVVTETLASRRSTDRDRRPSHRMALNVRMLIGAEGCALARALQFAVS